MSLLTLLRNGGGAAVISPSTLLSNFSDTGATSYTTASATYTNGKRYLLSVESRTNLSVDTTIPTASGSGLTITQVATRLFDTTSATRKRITVFEFVGNGTTGTITIDYAGQAQTSQSWIIDLLNNAETATSCVVQSASNSDDTVTLSTLSATLASALQTGSITYGVFSAGNAAAVITKGASLTKISEVLQTATVHQPLTTAYKSDLGKTADFSVGANDELGVIVLEIKKATSGGAVTGTLSSTLGNVTSNVSGAITVSGTLASTLGNVASNINGSAIVSGSLSSTLGNTSSNISGTTAVNGSIASTLDSIQSNIVGSVTSAGITGALSSTLANTLSTITGSVLNAGSISSTLGDVQSNISGSVTVRASVASVLGDVTASSTGSVKVIGTISPTLGNTLSAISAQVSFSGSINSTLGNVTSQIAGFVGTPSANTNNFKPIFRPRRR